MRNIYFVFSLPRQRPSEVRARKDVSFERVMPGASDSRERIGQWPSATHPIENIDYLLYVSNQVRDQGSRISPKFPLNRKRAVAGLETPNVGDEYPPSFLASPNDNRNIAKPRLLLSFENPYRGPGCIETNRQSRERKPGAQRRILRCGVRFYGGYERPVYQDLIEIVPQK